MAADFVTRSEIDEIKKSHKLSVETMLASAQKLGEHGIRSVQLWQQAAVLVDDEDEMAAAGVKIATRANASWATVKPHVVAGLDALAAATGQTRQQLIDELASAPATVFE